MEFTYKTSDVCSSEIRFRLDGNVVHDIRFVGGCNGNLNAISKILDGWTVEQIETKLKGNSCGGRPTSCADQLARAVRRAYDSTRNNQ